MRLAPGTRIGPYEIQATIGSGGMGEVYRAHDPRLARDVALKILRPHLANDADAMARFEREARAVAALTHPNILAIYDVGTHEGSRFVVTELLEGKTLRDRLNRAPLSWSQAAEIGAAVAEGIAAAHARGIVHRDLKPENILLTADGRVKILDFGLAAVRTPPSKASAAASATVTQEGTILGTVGYMSPEQVRSESANAASDIFSLGCVLYEMRAGKRAFDRPTAVQTLNAILESDPPKVEPRGNGSPEFDRLIARCLEKDPARRLQSARDLGRALGDLSKRSSSAEAGGGAGKRRHRLPVIVAAVLALLAIAVLATGPWRERFLGTPAVARIESLAVLPLEDLSGDRSQDFFAEGMTEALITNLGQIGGLRVIARPSVTKYRGTSTPLKDVARELGVQALLTGTVFRSGDRVRIATQLVDPEADRSIWSDSYERDVRDVLTLQREVTNAIALNVRATLTANQSASLGATRAVQPEAYELYLKARYSLGGATGDKESQSAIELLNRAIRIDPDFAPAHAGVARAYIIRRTRVAPEEAAELDQEAFAAVERALSLDPMLAEAYVARGDLLWTPSYRFAHERAVREFRRALELNPNLDGAHEGLSRVFAHVGFFEQALEHAAKALDSNPSNALALHHKSEALLWMGRNAEALAVLASIPRPVLPDLVQANIAWATYRMGNQEEALSGLRAYAREHGADPTGVLAAVEAILLATVAPEEARTRILEMAKRRGLNFDHHTEYFTGVAWAKMGRAKEAVRSFRRTAEAGFPCYPMLAQDTDLDPIRGDSEFQTFLRGLKKQTGSLRAALFLVGGSPAAG